MFLENMVLMGQLFPIYKQLLTDRQRDVMAMYYEEDFSLAEIAEQLNITRQGVRDNLKRAENALLHYEETLKVNQKRLSRLDYYRELLPYVTDSDGRELIQQLIQQEE